MFDFIYRLSLYESTYMLLNTHTIYMKSLIFVDFLFIVS